MSKAVPGELVAGREPRSSGGAAVSALVAAVLLPALAGVLGLLAADTHRARPGWQDSALPSSFALQHGALALSWGWTWLTYALVRGRRGPLATAHAQPADSPERWVLAALVALAAALLWLAGVEQQQRVDGGPLLLCLLSLPALCLAGVGLSATAAGLASPRQLIRLAILTTAPLAAGPWLALRVAGLPDNWNDAWTAVVFGGLSLPLGLVLFTHMLCWSRQGDREARLLATARFRPLEPHGS